MNPRKGKMQIVYDFFKKEIEDGNYSYGELFPTESDIAFRFNASRPTIAKALNLLKEEGYVTRKAGYGTTVVKEIHNQKSDEYTFGSLIPYLKDTEIFEPIFGEIANRANDNNFSLAVDENNFSLMWGGNRILSTESHEFALQIARNYVAQKVDGVFFSPLELSNDAVDINHSICELFSNANIPIVLLDRDFTNYPSTSSRDLVCMDHITAGYEIAKHLIDIGCTEIMFLSSDYVANTIDQRYIGVCIAAKEAPEREIKVKKVKTASTTSKTVENILRTERLCSLICYNDAIAAKIIPEFLERGVKIPQDLKVAGFDDVKYAKLLSIPLTTYRQPCLDIARAAVNILLERIKHPSTPTCTHQIKGELIIRQSTVE